MAETIPYLIPLTKVVSANSPDSLITTVPTGWTVRVKRWLWTSTGIFTITDIVDSRGVHYTPATQSNGILSTFVQSPANAFLGFDYFQTDLIVRGGDTLTISVIDTSTASNTLRLLLECIAELPQGAG